MSHGMKKIKVALVHDYLKEYGGAERVLEALHEIYPDAPVFTSVFLPEYLGPHRARFKNWDIRTSFLQKFPFKAKLISPFRLLSPWAFRSFDFSDFDFVIVSATGAYFPNIIKKKSALQICYCHTPPRYLYGYKTAREWKNHAVFRILGEIANHFLRLIDFKASQNVDFYFANSYEVAGRIKKFYRRDAVVIYPPVDVEASSIAYSVQLKKQKLNANQLNAKKYYVTGGRLARAKHVDLVIKACIELGLPLKVFGRAFAGYGEELKELAESGKLKEKSNIEFLGEVSDEEKGKLLSGAKAGIFAFEDEDFGILPVEVMGEGTPVIAYRSGGLKETVIEGTTGIFYDELTIVSLKNAIKKFERIKFYPENCRKQAANFNVQKFKDKLEQKMIELSQ